MILSLTLFVALVLGAGLWLFYPRADRGEPRIADASPLEEGRPFDPIEYLRGDDEEPVGIEPEEEPEDDDVIIVYGEPEDATTEEGLESEVEPDIADDVDADTREPRIVSESEDTRPSTDDATDRDGTATGDVIADGATEQPRAVAPPAATPREDVRRDRPVGAAANRKEAPPALRTESRPEPRLVTREEYWIQLISSPSLDTVEQARRRLNEWTISGLITSITKDHTTYYRLRVGPWIEKAEAEKFLDWIQGIDGFGTSYISLVYNERMVVN